MKKSTKIDILTTIYEISKIASHTTELKPAFEEISMLLYPVLNFDYLLIHQLDSHDQSHVIYAKSMTPGNPEETQLTWEEILSTIVINTENTIIQQSDPVTDTQSTNTIKYLGVPLVCGERCRGSVAFIRQGIEPFNDEEIQLAEFSTREISIIIKRDYMRIEEEIIDNQRTQAGIQEDFISQITHDLRNPLGVIKGYSTTLMRTDVKWGPEKTQEFLKIIDQEADRLQAMIDNLLDSARLQAGQLDMQFQITSMESIINNVVSKARNQYPLLVFHIEKDADLNPIYADTRRLTQVFENLLSNVDKHAPNSNIWIKISNNGSGLRVIFQDDGPGIPAEYLSKLFTRFFRVPQNAPNIHGSGLGLYICKQIIENHRGKITAYSEFGHGTTIQIDLPGK